MPDPAIEAIKAGLPYTEPTSRGLFSRPKKHAKAKITWEVNPLDPTAPPRRIIDVDGDSKGGWFGKRKFGSKVQWGQQHATSPGARPMPIPGQSAHSAAQGLTPTSTSLPANPAFPDWSTLPAPSGTVDPYLLPLQASIDPSAAGSHLLSRGQRRHLEKMRAEQEKAVREWDKAQREWEKAQGQETKRRVKEELKRKKDELKAQEKALRKQRKHPDRAMPTPTPASGVQPQPPVPAVASQSDTGNVKWMMTPTYEEFGVRRPLDASGTWPQVGGASEWPMMSRTMTHALVDMAREERVHAVSAGTVWGGGWGGQW